jgi:hypothetical protein
MKSNLSKKVLLQNRNIITKAIEEGEDNIDIFLGDDILEYSDTDLANYEKFLQEIAEAIIGKYPNRNIAVNVLTDIFMSGQSVREPEFYFCQFCPCFCCTPDTELFERGTNDKYTPPQQYCKKAFIELNLSKYICDTLGLSFNISDICWEDYKDLVYMLYCTSIRRDIWDTKKA